MTCPGAEERDVELYILLMGAPGAGKGTQGNVLGEHLGIPKIATGDLLRAARAAGTELGRKAQTFMDQGQLVPDDIILGMVEAELAKPEAQRGAILDGFPLESVPGRSGGRFACGAWHAD